MNRYLTASEYVALGYDPDKKTVNKFGRNTDIDISGGPEDVIGIGGDLELFSAAATVDIASGSTNDDLGGSGAEKVMLYGLDANYALQEQEFELNGTGTVVTTGYTWTFIYRASVTQSNNGANDAYNAGIITFGITSGNDVMNIAIGDNQTLHCAYMIPVGHVGLLKRHKFSIENNAAATVAILEVWVKPFGLPWLLKYRIDVADNEQDDMIYEIPKVIPEKAIIKLRADTDVDNTVVNGYFDLKLIDV